MQGTIQLVTSVSSDLVDDLSDLLLEQGALAISLIDSKDEPVFQLSPDETPLWQETTIKALFAEDVAVEPLVARIKQEPLFSMLSFSLETVAQKNWVIETQKQFPPKQFGQLWVCPVWDKSTFETTDPVLYISPGLAFGTGTHPTTHLCLEWLSQHPPKNQTVVDYGCGSGILALASIVLGAKTVYATDHDVQALESTLQNAQHNVIEENKLHIKKTHEMQNIQADLVIANILANPLIELSNILCHFLQPGGTLVLSGLLQSDKERVMNAYTPYCQLTQTIAHEEWMLLELIRQ